MTPIKRKLLYIFRGDLLRLRISWNHGEIFTMSIGIRVDRMDEKGKPKWDGFRCIRNTTHGPDKMTAANINRILDKLEEKVDAAFLVFESEDSIPTKEEIKAILSVNDGNTKSKSFFEAYDEFLEDGIKNKYWSDGTLKKLKSRKNLLLEFDPNLSFRSLSKTKLNEFINFQTRNSITRNKDCHGYLNTTIKKNINLLKWFLKWADEKGYNVNPDYRKFSPSIKTPQKSVIFLEWEELMKLYNHDFSSNPHKEAVRDCFCFCCFTSLRYSDLYNLKKSDIGKDCITVTTIKTTDTITIDLNDYSREILKKYKDIPGDKALPVLSNQKMNVALKTIAKECGIQSPVTQVTFKGSERIETSTPKYRLITTHCGRRTFICNALMLGIPPHVVMKWTGHSDYKAMEPYIAIADKMKKKSMEYFNRK